MKKTLPVQTVSFNKILPENNFYFTKSENLTEHFPLHTHDYFEIEIIVSGKALTSFNGVEIELSRGNAHILSPTDVHDLQIIEPIEIYKIMLLSNWVNEKMLYDLMENLGTVKFTEQELTNIIPLLHLLLKEGNSTSKQQKDMLYHLLSCLIIFFSRKQKINYKDKHNIATANAHIKKAVNYILLNYVNDISSADVAKAVNLNPVYFSTLFKETTGVTFINYLSNLRLERAKQLLMIESYSVSEVCYACGFNSSSNFLRAFRKKYNISPNQLKTKYKNEKILSNQEK